MATPSAAARRAGAPRCAVVAAILAPTLAFAAGPSQAWPSAAGKNCYSSEEGFVGGLVVSEATNPILRHMSLGECMAACLAEPSCEGVAMQETYFPNPTCWLRKGVVMQRCTSKFPDFTTWLKPGSESANAALASSPSWLVSAFPGASCAHWDRGQGRPFVGLSLTQCEHKCQATADCRSITYAHIPGPSTEHREGPTCFFWPFEDTRGCTEANPDQEIRIVKGNSLATTTPAPATGAPAAAKTSTGWATLAGTKCLDGAGGRSVGRDLGTQPPLLQSCQASCKANLECEAFIVRDTHEDAVSECHLITAIDLGDCEKDDSYDMWFNPQYYRSVNGGVQWTSYAGKSCPLGKGAEPIAASPGSLQDNTSLAGCEAACLQAEGCEAVVWHVASQGGQRCELRRGIRFEACEDGNHSLDLRVAPTGATAPEAQQAVVQGYALPETAAQARGISPVAAFLGAAFSATLAAMWSVGRRARSGPVPDRERYAPMRSFGAGADGRQALCPDASEACA